MLETDYRHSTLRCIGKTPNPRLQFPEMICRRHHPRRQPGWQSRGQGAVNLHLCAMQPIRGLESLFMHRLVYAPDRGDFPEPGWATQLIDHPAGYLAGEGLVHAVNVALALEKPLLLTGEPGTGKTQLAYSIAYCLGLTEPIKLEAKSSMEQREFFYTYDTVGRFQAAQEQGAAAQAETFVSLQGLGLAIARSRSPDDTLLAQRLPSIHALARGERTVVLIDEIDKAPRDVPNDVLNEVENMYFRIRECANETVSGNPALKPVVMFTSNSERFLPDAFLRRCIFYDIPFPTDEQLNGIIASRLLRRLNGRDKLVQDCVDFVRFLRSPNAALTRRPGPAELLDWLKALLAIGAHPENSLARAPELATATAGAIIKSREDQARFSDLFTDWRAGVP